MPESITGGCQCGAVRYCFSQKPAGAHICHCRMCQKAFGAFYAPLVGGPRETFAITRGVLAIFRSSDLAERGFCADCGTPLTFRYVEGKWMSVSIGSLDDPETFPPIDQHGIESRLSWVNRIGVLPDRPTTEEEDPEDTAAISASNRQHPDHDTKVWPNPKKKTMTKDRLYLFDTTLRDGAQTAGVEFSLEDKIAIAKLLDGLGIDYVEGGYPGANVVDSEFFGEKRTQEAQFVAFGMTKRAGRSVDNDPGIAALLESRADAVCYVSKAWDHQVKLALGISTRENLKSLSESVAAAIAAGKEAYVDCEHFFDGYKANRDYALSCVSTALEAGARWVVLCDTNGGTLPAEIETIVADVLTIAPGDRLGIHAHDDTGHAVANSLAAVRAGVRQIQGTLNGLGERCGNANLVTLIPTLVLKPVFSERFETGVTAKGLESLTHVSRAFDEILNRAPNRQAPYVGASAFATKAGIHASAIAKDPSTYEHVPPEAVGNERMVMVSQQAGKSNLLNALGRFGIEIAKDDPRLDRLLRQVKEREARGYSYDGAEASFFLLARRMLGTLPQFFTVASYRVGVERRYNAKGELVTVSDAVVKLDVDGETLMSVAEGNGPVNALDLAMRKDLGKYSQRIDDLELVDFKVRILDGGTGAVTRVLIESRDRAGERWFTVGVSPNIIDASFEALYESFTYKLMKTSSSL